MAVHAEFLAERIHRRLPGQNVASVLDPVHSPAIERISGAKSNMPGYLNKQSVDDRQLKAGGL